jgi:hypothetical protein
MKSRRLSQPARVTPTSSGPDSRLPTLPIVFYASDTLSNPPTLGSAQLSSNRAGRDVTRRPKHLRWFRRVWRRHRGSSARKSDSADPPLPGLPTDTDDEYDTVQRRAASPYPRPVLSCLPDHGRPWSPGKPVEASAGADKTGANRPSPSPPSPLSTATPTPTAKASDSQSQWSHQWSHQPPCGPQGCPRPQQSGRL